MRCLCQNEMHKCWIHNISYYKCPNCGYLRKENPISMDEEKKRYDYHICDDSYRKYMQGIQKLIQQWIVGTSYLDYGCGKVPVLAELLSCDYYDLYYYPTPIVKKYDTIILVEVFEHIRDLKQELKKLEGYLKSGGRLIILTKPYVEEKLENWWYLRDITHLNFIKKDTLKFWKINFRCIDQKEDIFVLERI